MKRTIFKLTGIAIITASIMAGCNSPSEKLRDAKENVADADADLEKAKQEYFEDMKQYRIESAARIAENEKNLAEFKQRISKDKKDAKDDYNEKILALEKKNTDLKKRLDDYEDDGIDKWKSFKTEFGKDMDSLGVAFKNITTKKNK